MYVHYANSIQKENWSKETIHILDRKDGPDGGDDDCDDNDVDVVMMMMINICLRTCKTLDNKKIY